MSEDLAGNQSEVIDEAIDIATTLMTPAQGRNRALRIFDLLSVFISQTTVSAGANNTFTFVLVCEEDLVFPFQFITIFGLRRSATPSGSISIVSPFTSTGNWSQAQGTLTFAFNSTVPKNQNHSFTFQLRNPSQGQDSPTVSMQMEKTEYNNVTWTAGLRNITYPSDIHFQPLHVAYFYTKRIGQSNFRGSQQNVLSVTLVPSVDLGHSQGNDTGAFAITISSLKNAQFPTGSIQLIPFASDTATCTGNCTLHFSDSPNGPPGRGSWQGASAGNESLILYVIKPLLAGNTYKFAFEITNPAAGQSSPSVAIESNGYNSEIFRDEMEKAGRDFDPLVIAGFFASIGQSTPSQDALNRISITLVPYTYLAEDILLTISGMNGSFHPNGQKIGSLYSGALDLVSSGCIDPLNETDCRNLFELPASYVNGSTGQGMWDDLTKTLELRVAKPILGGSVIRFAWILYNGIIGQDAPDIFISGQGLSVTGEDGNTNYSIVLHPYRIQHAMHNDAPLLLAKFDTKSIKQTTSLTGAVNEISINVSVNFILENATISFSGLEETLTPDQTLPLTSGPYTSPENLASSGLWTKSTGTLSVFSFRLEPKITYTFNFNIMNPFNGQASPPIYVQGSSPVLTMSQQLMSYPYYDVAPLYVHGFVERTIKQHSEFPGALNTLTVILTCSIAQEATTQITISGLVSTQTTSGILELVDPDHTGIFNLSAMWSQPSGTLVVDLLATMTEGVRYAFTLQVTNPTIPQDAPIVQVETQGPSLNSNLRVSSMVHGLLNEAALVIIGWDFAKIGQATPAVSAENTLTVTLATYGSFVVNKGRSLEVSITGLLGSSMPSRAVRVFEPQTYDSHGVLQSTGNEDMFSEVGYWNATTGTFVFTVINTTESRTRYVLSFAIQNPASGQDMPEQINISAAWPIPPVPMNTSTGVETPLLVHSFVTSYIEQNDPGTGANNTFELELTSRSDLPCSPSHILVTDPGYDYIDGELIVPNTAISGAGFRAAFTVHDGAINGTRILSLGENYSQDTALIPVYAGTEFAMKDSISVAQVVTAGRNYVPADVVATHPFAGQGFLATTSVNETDGAVTGILVLNHGEQYGNAGYLAFVQFYPGTGERMELSITGLNLLDPISTSGCTSETIITAVGGGGENFRARIDRVTSGKIATYSILNHGRDYTSDPQLVMSHANCRCKGLPGNIPGNFDPCVTPRRAHGATIGGRVAREGSIEAQLPRVYIELPGIDRNDTGAVQLVRYGFNYADGTQVFGSFGSWIKASQTLVMHFAGPTMIRGRNYKLEFYLENPRQFQEGPPIFIYTTGLTGAKALVNTAPAGNIRNALSIAGFFPDSIVSHTNPAQNGTNEIRIKLMPQLNHPVSPRVELIAPGLDYGPGDLRIFDQGVEVSSFNATFTTFSDGRIDKILNRRFGDDFRFTPTCQVLVFLSSTNVTQEERVRTLEIKNPGSGHADGTFPLVVECNWPTCQGSGFSATYTVEGGVVVSWTILDRGAGYSMNAPIVHTQGCNLQPNFGWPCVAAHLIAYVPKGATFRLFPPFVKVSGLTGAQKPESGVISISSFQNNATSVFGSNAVWNREEGSLLLELLRTAYNGTAYGLSFVVVNQKGAQRARIPVIAGQAGFRYSVQQLATATGNSAPLLVCNVSRGFISQDNSGQGQVNKLTASFVLTVNIFATDPRTSVTGLTGAYHPRLTLFGLTGTAEPSGLVPITGSGGSYKDGVWDQGSGVLVISVDSDLAAGTEHSFSFFLTNPLGQRGAANVSMASVFFLQTPMTSSQDNSAPLAIIGLVVASIAQNNPSAGAVNTLTVTLQTSQTMLSKLFNVPTLVVIQGLTSTGTRDIRTLPLTQLSGQVHTIFGTSGVWKQAPGALILTMLHDAPASQDIVFSFQLQNPDTPQPAPVISILTAQGHVMAPKRMKMSEGLASALLIAGFTHALATQSTPSQSAANTITIVFASNFPLSKGNTNIITVDGLTGSATDGDQYLSLTAGDIGAFGDGMGGLMYGTGIAFWRHNRRIELTVDENIGAGNSFSVSFVLKNPSQAQVSPYIQIRANGAGFSTPWQAVAKPQGNGAPLLIAGFSFVSMGQSNAIPGGRNTIAVTFATNCDLVSSSVPALRLVVTGLDNASSTTELVHLHDKANDFVSIITSGVASFTASHGGSKVTYKSLSINLTRPQESNESDVPRVSSGTLYAFDFVLINPQVQQEPPPIFLSLIGAITIGPVEAHRPVGLDAVLRIFTFATVTGNLSGATTTWSERSHNTSMGPRRGFNAVFLPGFSIGPASAQTVFGHQGQWYQSTGTIILPISEGQTMPRGSSHVISFEIDNAVLPQESVNAYIMSGGARKIYAELMQGETEPLSFPGSVEGDASPLKLYSNTWAVVEIGQDSPFPSVVNTIHVTLSSWQGLEQGTILDIWGLLGSTTSSTVVLPITDYTDGPSVFSSTGTWIAASGQLLVATTQALDPSTLYHFSFSLTNLPFEYQSPTVSIEARGGLQIPPTIMTTNVNKLNSALSSLPYLTDSDAFPLRVRPVEFYIRNIGQSRAYPGASNTITVSLASTVTLSTADASKVTLSGILGAAGPGAGEIPISYVTSQQVFGLTALWDPDTGRLFLALAQDMVKGTLHIFSFSLINPNSAHEAASVFIRASGSQVLYPASMIADVVNKTNETGTQAGDACVLKTYPPTLIVRNMGQSSPYPSALNTLTVTLASTVELDGATSELILLSDIKGSVSADDGSIPLSSPTPWLFPATAIWDGDADDSFNRGGILGVRLLNTSVVAPGQAIVFSFALINPAGALPAPPEIHATWTGASSFVAAGIRVDGASTLPLPGSRAGDAIPLNVQDPSFVLHSVRQTSVFPWARNEIHVSVAANFMLSGDAHTMVIMHGLLGSASGLAAQWDRFPNQLALTYASGSPDVFGQRGLWSRDTGQLHLHVQPGRFLLAGQVCAFSFQLRNPGFETTESSELWINSSSTSVFQETPLKAVDTLPSLRLNFSGSVAGDALPLRVQAPGFSFALLRQSTTFPGLL
jgi:hypothetical protein